LAPGELVVHDGDANPQHRDTHNSSHLYCSISLKATVTRHAPTLSISKFGKGHASRGRLSNLPRVTQGSKLPVRPQKAKIFDSMSKISLVSRQILAVVEMSNWFFGSRVTPSVDLNEILQYTVCCEDRDEECQEKCGHALECKYISRTEYLEHTAPKPSVRMAGKSR
jgi:hypothetical protein